MIRHRFVPIRHNGKPHGLMHILQFLPLTSVEIIPTDICYIRLSEHKHSMYLTIYMTLVYGVVFPLNYCFLTGIYIRMVYILRISRTGTSGSTENYHYLYLRLTIICLINLVSAITIGLVTYISASGSVSMETNVLNCIFLIFCQL